MYVIFNVTENKVVSPTPTSKTTAVEFIAILRSNSPDVMFKLYYLMVEGE